MGDLQQDALVPHFRRQVTGRQHGDHARHGAGILGVDLGEGGMGEGAAHEGGFQHPRQFQIVQELAAAGQQVRVFQPLHALADEGGRAHALAPSRRAWAAASAARTMVS